MLSSWAFGDGCQGSDQGQRTNLLAVRILCVCVLMELQANAPSTDGGAGCGGLGEGWQGEPERDPRKAYIPKNMINHRSEGIRSAEMPGGAELLCSDG